MQLYSQVENKKMEKIYHGNINQKKGVVIPIKQKMDFTTQKTTKGKEDYYMITKRSVHQEYIMVQMCTHQTTEPKNR